MDDVVFSCFDAVPPGEVLHVCIIGRGRGNLCFRLTGTDRAIRWAEAIVFSGTAVVKMNQRDVIAKFRCGTNNAGFVGDAVKSEMLVDLLPQEREPN